MKPMKASDSPTRAIVHDRLTDKRTFAFVGYPGASILVPLLRCWQLREHLNAQNGEPIQHFVDGVSVKVEMNVDRRRQALSFGANPHGAPPAPVEVVRIGAAARDRGARLVGGSGRCPP